MDKVEAFKDPKHPQRFAVESIGPGQVMVVDSLGDGRAASAGEILITRIAKRGGVGFITDGSVRDSFEMDSIGIPVYTILRIIAREFFSEFKLVQRLTDHMDDDDEEEATEEAQVSPESTK